MINGPHLLHKLKHESDSDETEEDEKESSIVKEEETKAEFIKPEEVKRPIGKPKTDLLQYHQECKEMIRNNTRGIAMTTSQEEKFRLQCLTNSTMQRLKRRRREHFRAQSQVNKDNRIKSLLNIVEEIVSKDEFK